MDILTQFLPVVTQYSKFFAQYAVSLDQSIWGYCGVVLIVLTIADWLSKRWITATPNQWLLIIRGGKCVKSGVGINSFVLPNETIVKFPSLVKKAQFSANNITKEMQGVQISGYAFWGVSTKDEGPFKCYKYMQGGNPNSNVQTMCESIVRSELANSSLLNLIQNREELRQKIIKQLSKILEGWGIELQTVELTEVKICSRALFEDLQAEYRQQTHLSAEQKKYTTNERLRCNELQSELKIKKYQFQSETNRLIESNRQELRRAESEIAFYEQDCRLKAERLTAENEMELKKIRRDSEINQQNLKNELEIRRNRKQKELNRTKLQIENDKLLTKTHLKKYAMDINSELYRRIYISELKVNKFVDQDAECYSVRDLLPGI